MAAAGDEVEGMFGLVVVVVVCAGTVLLSAAIDVGRLDGAEPVAVVISSSWRRGCWWWGKGGFERGMEECR